MTGPSTGFDGIAARRLGMTGDSTDFDKIAGHEAGFGGIAGYETGFDGLTAHAVLRQRPEEARTVASARRASGSASARMAQFMTAPTMQYGHHAFSLVGIL